MTNRKQKLELTWIGKEHRPQLEPRLLIEDAGRSYHAAQDLFAAGAPCAETDV